MNISSTDHTVKARNKILERKLKSNIARLKSTSMGSIPGPRRMKLTPKRGATEVIEKQKEPIIKVSQIIINL